jgi:signal transduction histidine kinase
VHHNGWVVGFTLPAAVVDGQLTSRLQRDLGIIAGLLIGGFLLILLISSRLSRPLSLLARSADEIARGDRPLIPLAAADADVRKLESAMDTMSRAVADREKRLRAQTQVLETLERVGGSLATELDFERAVALIAQASMRLTQSEAVTFYYEGPAAAGQDDDAGEDEPKQQDGLNSISFVASREEPVATLPLQADDPILAQVLTKQTIRSEDVVFLPLPPRPRPLEEDGSRPVRSLLGLPVVSRDGTVRGALLLMHSQPGYFQEEHFGLATGLARRGGIVLENAWLYSEARAVQDELRRANVAKDEFIGVMSHELRTPITTIYGGARLLNARRRHLDESDVDEMIASIEEEAERLYRLVENLLALARMELGAEISQDPIAVGPVIEQVIKQFGSRHPNRPIEVSLADALPLAKGDSTYLHQVLHNLITNADKYSEQGLPIEVSASADDNEITVTVRDHGKGVDPAELGQIFESFYRSQRTAREARGKGLGLTVCKRLVETMGGEVWARNADSGGLIVGFTLPVASVEDPELEPAPVAAKPLVS